jgi:hypothetical protein
MFTPTSKKMQEKKNTETNSTFKFFRGFILKCQENAGSWVFLIVKFCTYKKT